ncbi:cnx-1 [Pristionchus pacificus]|uniref:Cnx-1 n=1 Tax=Pristionchus pacificus TaxID=54126 RepID=A0A2A6CHY3_PRIPA|nr:cnx-1 [Pristionchus pacificus]|eukprot:PDM77631.1 cnx-1 [Pristionchus pacificus]
MILVPSSLRGGSSSSWAATLALLLAAAAVLQPAAAAADDVDDDEEGGVPIDQKKEEFVPIKFVEPKLTGDAMKDANVHMWEYFRGRGGIIGKTWLKSKAKKDGVEAEISKYNGEWDIGAPSEVAIEGDYSLVVKTDARHHAIASKLAKPFSFADGKPLVMQYEVRYEEGQNCGGGYVKLLSEGAEKALEEFNDKTGYTIMFGPDKCSPNGKVHLIFRYRNPKNGTISEHAARQPDTIAASYWDDHKTHLYTLTVKPDGSYTVAVDYKSLYYGSILKDVTPALEPPKQIADPDDVKPADWDDRAEIEDETATKPDDWDESAPKEIVDEAAEKPADWLEEEQPLIADPKAEKPEDWDEEMDGEWEPPMIENAACAGLSGCGEWKRPTIKNPAYKGKWRRPRMANPAFKGVWAPRQIDNPAYFDPSESPLAGLAPVSALGIELWTMSKNIMFDNLLIADSEAVATHAAALTYDIRKAEESRLRSSKGEGNGIFSGLIDAAEDKPWLWAVYVLAMIIPIIIIAVFCFGRKSGPDGPDVAYRKKYDVPTADDDEPPNLVNEDGEEEEQIEEEDDEAAVQAEVVQQLEKAAAEKRRASKSPARKQQATPTAAAAGSGKKKSVREQIEVRDFISQKIRNIHYYSFFLQADDSEDSDDSSAGDAKASASDKDEEVAPAPAPKTAPKKRGRAKKAD